MSHTTDLHDGLHMGRGQPGEESTMFLGWQGFCSLIETLKRFRFRGNEQGFGHAEFGGPLGRLSGNVGQKVNQSLELYGVVTLKILSGINMQVRGAHPKRVCSWG